MASHIKYKISNPKKGQCGVARLTTKNTKKGNMLS